MSFVQRLDLTESKNHRILYIEERARAAGTSVFSEPDPLNVSQAFRFKPRVAIIVSPSKSRSFSLTVEGGPARWVRGLEPRVGRGGNSLNSYRSRQGLTPTRSIRESRKPRPRLRFGLVWNGSFPPASGITIRGRSCPILLRFGYRRSQRRDRQAGIWEQRRR